MKIHGAFAYTDVMFKNNSEPTLALESTAGFATLVFPYLPLGAATPTGLANDATAYTASIDVDAPGTPIAVSVTGSAAQTFATLIAEINTDLGAAATASLVGNNIVITSATTGATSAVVVTDGTLFASIKGTGYKMQGITNTRGHVKYLRLEQLDKVDQDELYTVMATLNPTATDWVHANDKVTVTDTVFTATTAITGLAAGTYSLGVTVDGVAKQVAFTIAVDATMTDIYNAFAAAMSVAFPAATVTMTDVTNVVTLIVTTGTPGTEGNVTVVDGTTAGIIAAINVLASATLVAALGTGVTGAVGTVGSLVGHTTYFEALTAVKSPVNGATILSSVGPTAIVEREDKPTMRYIPRADGTYYNGSAWVTWTA